MNQDTMSQKATLALVTMAAAKEEGNFTSRPNEDTLTVIDDTLSMATKISPSMVSEPNPTSTTEII
jgi:hypothetical protein